MDAEWLSRNSFPERKGVRELLEEVDRRHFWSGNARAGALSDLFSDLDPSAREYFWGELASHATAYPNLSIEDVRERIDSKLAEYPLLPSDPRAASDEVFRELRQLWERFEHNPASITRNDTLSVNGFYFEIRWILGQILATCPDVLELSSEELDHGTLPAKYSKLEPAWDVVEHLVKTLSDQHVQDFYSDHPQALAAQLQVLLAP